MCQHHWPTPQRAGLQIGRCVIGGSEGRVKNVVRGADGLPREMVPSASIAEQPGLLHCHQGRSQRLLFPLARTGVAPSAHRLRPHALACLRSTLGE